jgi:hypothetical protein
VHHGLGLGVFVELASELESFRGVGFGARDSADLGAFCRTADGVCIREIAADMREAELAAHEAATSAVQGPRDIARTYFPALIFHSIRDCCGHDGRPILTRRPFC